MDRVLDRLWIGSARDFGAPLRQLGFSAALDLRDGLARGALNVVEGVATFRVGNCDGDPWSRDQVVNALDFVAERVQRGRVLVACAAGMSRSACMAIGYLVRTGWDEASAYERVRQARSRVAPIGRMLDSVLAAVRA